MSEQAIRKQLQEALEGGHAHATFGQIVEGFPADRAGVRPPGMTHSAWELLEHLRIAQRDIVEFSRSADWVPPEFPAGYWPASAAPAHPDDWAKSVQQVREDLAIFTRLIADPAQDLYRAFPWGDGQNLLREALLIIDHNSYHLGQLLQVKQAVAHS